MEGGDEDKELLENLLKSMRKTGAVAEPPTKKKETRTEISEQGAPSIKIRGKPQDGERSANSGPCNCGYKHFLDGVEYDYVFQIGTTNGPKKIGYNQNDNPYIVAQDFMMKSRLNEKSLNDTPYISALANAIMDNTKEHEKNREENGLGPFRKEEEAKGEPYKVPASGVNYNKQTSETEVTVDEHQKLAQEEEKRRKEMSEDAKKKYQEEKLRKEIEKQRIKDQLRLDKLEREAKRKNEQEKYAAPPNRMTENEILKVSRSSDDLQDFSRGNQGEGDEESAFSIRRVPSPLERSSLYETNSLESTKSDKKSGFMTISQLQSQPMQEDSSEFPPTPNRKEEWTLPLMLAKMQQFGKSKLTKLLLESHFSLEETDNLIKIVTMLEAKRQSEELQRQRMMSVLMGNSDPSLGKKKEDSQNFRAFSGHGQTLTNPSFGQTWGKGASEDFLSIYNTPASAEESITVPYELKLDSSQPVVSIQIRLHNGTKLLGKFNPSHTIQDVRFYIESQFSGSNYDLMMSFPRKSLSDLSQTIQSAGLANAAIVQVPR